MGGNSEVGWVGVEGLDGAEWVGGLDGADWGGEKESVAG